MRAGRRDPDGPAGVLVRAVPSPREGPVETWAAGFRTGHRAAVRTSSRKVQSLEGGGRLCQVGRSAPGQPAPSRALAHPCASRARLAVDTALAVTWGGARRVACTGPGPRPRS